MARVLAEDLVHRPQRLESPQGDVEQVPDGGAHHVEGALGHGGEEYTCRMKLTIARVGEASVFRIGGKVGWESSRRLENEVRDALEAGARFLVFQLDTVQFLSSGAIGVLVYHLRKLQGGAGDIFVVTSNSYVLYLFQTIGFHRVFEGKIFRSMGDLDVRLAGLVGGWTAPRDDSWREVEDAAQDDDERSQREEGQ